MNIPFQGKLSKKEYKQVLVTHLNLPVWLKWFLAGAALVVFFGGVFVLIRQPELTTSLLPGLIFPIVFLTLPLWLPEIQASSYNQPGNVFREGLQGTITDTEISIQTSKGSSITLWSGFTHYKSTESIVLLYQNKNYFNLFLRSMFASIEDWNAFRGEVASRLPKK